jgi:hypothetical protein
MMLFARTRNYFMALTVFFGCMGGTEVRAQNEVSSIEKFALAGDRSQALTDLIPGTEEYFFLHALHFQNSGQFEKAQAMLVEWKTKQGDGQRVQNMQLRQSILTYEAAPEQTLEFLRQQLGIQLHHSAPSKNIAATIPNKFDNAAIDTTTMHEAMIARDRSLSLIESHWLPLVLDRDLAPDQLRAVLGRLQRADLPTIVKRIAQELAANDSRGFGWAAVHQQLTLVQLDELAKLKPDLLGNEAFVRAYTQRLAPHEGAQLSDPVELRSYLMRLRDWTKRLPQSQDNLKAQVLGNLLKLNMQQGNYDRGLFVEYLALPRPAVYYVRQLTENRPVVDLGYRMQPQLLLPPVGNDDALVGRYLEQFLAKSDKMDDFAKYISDEYLKRVLAESRILSGSGDAATWYSKLTADAQRAIRDRVELKFAPDNVTSYEVDQLVKLQVELKNVPQLLVKVYQINTLAYFRNHGAWIKSDLDLDGLVPNREQRIEFQQPADRRHRETLDFPDLTGRGVWVVDLIGGGERSRAMIEKGRLLALQRITAAGHVMQVVDELGQPVADAHVELGGQQFKPNEKLQIVVSYSENTSLKDAMLVQGEYASPMQLTHLSENYSLDAKFVIDRQSLVAGSRAKLLVQAYLTCNGHRTSIKLLDDAELVMTAVDLDGISTQHVVNKPELLDDVEYRHQFLVPQRLASLSFTLRGKVYNQVRDVKVDVASDFSMTCNNIHRSAQIGDFFLQPTPEGYRLAVRGKNGEPLANMPVNLQLKLQQFTEVQRALLATNAQGVIDLGQLKDVRWIQVDSAGLQPNSFELRELWRKWPAQLHVGKNDLIQLTLGADHDDLANFELAEIRQGAVVRLHNDRLKVESSLLKVSQLSSGDYRLADRRQGQVVMIRVSDTASREYLGVGAFSVGKHRILQHDQYHPVSVQSLAIEDKKLRIKVAGADEDTRIHVLALPYSAPTGLSGLFEVSNAPGYYQSRIVPRTVFQDSLKIDEEYRYILDRQGMKIYPGNMLPQPSLLIHPWEVSVTQNQLQQAMLGDPMSAAAPAPASPEGKRMSEQAGAAGNDPGWKSYDFLRAPAVVLDNQIVTDGLLEVPIQEMSSYSHFIVQVMNASSVDCRRLTLPANETPVLDGRLATAFPADKTLAQTQKIQIVDGGQKTSFGDPRSRSIQAYSSIADLFQYYGSLLKTPAWEEFRFLTRWTELSAEQKREAYSEKACHELNFFLYHKDQEFFNQVIKPFIAQKLDKQLVDRWLLGESLEVYMPLWYQSRLNTLERVLLSQRIQSQSSGVKRWLKDYTDSKPFDPQSRQVRFLTGKLQLGRTTGTIVDFMDVNSNGLALGESLKESEELFRSSDKAKDSPAIGRAKSKPGMPSRLDDDSGLRSREKKSEFFQSLDKTREWAETQYYRVRLTQQTADLIPPNLFWLEYLAAGKPVVLNSQIDIPCTTIHDALCALAVIDLPLAAKPPQISVEDNQLFLQSENSAVVFVESIDSVQQAVDKPAILVGHDIFLKQPSVASKENKSLNNQPLLKGVSYRASIVLSNPTDKIRNVQVLTQLPTGSIPLSGSKFTRSTPVDLQPYSTSQLAYEFYFPTSGQFEQYGIQVSEEGASIAQTKSQTLKVLDEPESVDETTWSYVADWGTDQQVLEFLKNANLASTDLARIAFRMKDAGFFKLTTEYLESQGRFDPTLWGYATQHNSLNQLQTLLQQRVDLVGRLGPTIRSKLLSLDPQQQMSYEHLDYKPLVVARSHQLGAKRTILNSGLVIQYHRLLDLLAHQSQPTNDQRLQLCYYMLLQNRLDEAISWFDSVDKAQLHTQLQYDYFAAYIAFYKGQYEQAESVAQKYIAYPVPRWQQLFGQVRDQVAQRNAMLQDRQVEVIASTGTTNPAQRMLVGGREVQQSAAAQAQPMISLEQEGASLLLSAKNLQQVQVKYYLMDIELLFSRNPFVVQGNDSVPVIQPNLSETIAVTGDQQVELKIPETIRNRNVLVEVSGGGQSQSRVITANSLSVSVAETQGLLSVRAAQGKGPVEKAYVKVYAQHNDGAIRFYKDGYTDLRGQFDYATLSTSELDSASRFAILILHPEHGAVVREAKVPTR